MPSRIITPPQSDLTSFETFSAAMTSAPLDDLYKLYDSDGEPDLEGDELGDESDEDLAIGQGAAHLITHMSDPFGDSDDDGDNEMDEDLSPYEYFDPRFDIDRTKLTPEHAKSRHINPELQSMVDRTESFLEQLSLKFQPAIEEQPMSTTIVLANQAVEKILMPYRVHGSQARLGESAMKFLAGGTRVRRPGKDGMDGSKDGELRFTEQIADEKKDPGRVERLKRKADEMVTNDDASKSRSLKIKIVKRGDGTSVIVPATPNTSTLPAATSPPVPKDDAEEDDKYRGTNAFGERVGYGFQPASSIPLDGPKTQVDSLSNRKTSGPLDLCESPESVSRDSVGEGSKEMNICDQDSGLMSIRSRPRPILTIDTKKPAGAKTVFTPLAKSFSTVAIQTPISSPGDLSQAVTVCDQPGPYSCTIDAAANAGLALEAYNPLSMKLIWPASTIVRGEPNPCMPTPTILDALNNIIHLYNAEGRNLLSYYVRKYDKPAEHACLPSSRKSSSSSTSGQLDEKEPPHALFRLGISQYLHSKVGNIVTTKATDELGLNPEARRILGEVWERHPSINATFSDDFVDSDNFLSNQKSDSAFGRSSYPPPSSSSGTTLPDYESDMDVDAESDAHSTVSDIGPEYARRRNLHKFHLGLNPIERALLARACNVSVETVEAYWDDMRQKTKAWGAMKLWCEVQSKKKIEKAKKEGRW